MNQEVKALLLTVGIAVGVVWLFMPKQASPFGSPKSEGESKYSMPKIASEATKKQHTNAVIGMQAMRDAISAGEAKSELDKLSSEIYKKFNIKVVISTKTGKLRAMDASGNVIAEEE